MFLLRSLCGGSLWLQTRRRTEVRFIEQIDTTLAIALVVIAFAALVVKIIDVERRK
jgi:hypothetical protein